MTANFLELWAAGTTFSGLNPSEKPVAHRSFPADNGLNRTVPKVILGV